MYTVFLEAKEQLTNIMLEIINIDNIDSIFFLSRLIYKWLRVKLVNIASSFSWIPQAITSIPSSAPGSPRIAPTPAVDAPLLHLQINKRSGGRSPHIGFFW
jgi:hypothetical protein